MLKYVFRKLKDCADGGLWACGARVWQLVVDLKGRFVIGIRGCVVRLGICRGGNL